MRSGEWRDEFELEDRADPLHVTGIPSGKDSTRLPTDVAVGVQNVLPHYPRLPDGIDLKPGGRTGAVKQFLSERNHVERHFDSFAFGGRTQNLLGTLKGFRVQPDLLPLRA